MESPEPGKITSKADLDDLISKNTVIVIDFHAVWCGPCKFVAPFFASLHGRFGSPGKVVFVKCNVDEAQELSQQFEVTAMPTFLIIKNGREVHRIRGMNNSELEKAVKNYAGDILGLES